MKEDLKLVDSKGHHNKQYSDVVNISNQVKYGYLKFYVEKSYIYCENTITKERVIVGNYEISIGIDIGISSDKLFENIKTLDTGSVSRTRDVYHE